MRGRTVILFLIALLLAGGTAILLRSWLAQRAVQAAVPPPAAAQESILVARVPITLGQILKPTDIGWQPWPDKSINRAYILAGTEPAKTFAGWVAREPFAAGEPIIRVKIVSPGDRGFLAAVLRPGMRAVSVPITATSGISGFVFPGDRVDILITHPIPDEAAGGSGNDVRHMAAETVLRDVRVIAIDQKLDSQSGQAVLAHTATLEVTPKQSEIIAVASDIGKLSLSLRSLFAATGELPSGEKPPAEKQPGDNSSAAPPPGDKPSANSPVHGGRGTYTLDSDVSRLIPQPFIKKPNLTDDSVTILRGNGNSGNSTGSQPAARGS